MFHEIIIIIILYLFRMISRVPTLNEKKITRTETVKYILCVVFYKSLYALILYKKKKRFVFF